MSEVITYEQWLAALDEAYYTGGKPGKDGWHTMKDWAAIFKRRRETVLALVRRLLHAGLWEKRCFHVRLARGFRRVPHYRPKPSKLPVGSKRKG